MEQTRESLVLDQAFSLPPTERASFLHSAGLSQDRIASLLHLLSGVDNLGSFMQRPAASLDTRSPQLQPGCVLDQRFTILEFAGRGGMAEVYRAEHGIRKETVALKICRESLISDEAAAATFKNEVAMAAKVSHPNVCRIHDIFSDPSLGGHAGLFFTMDWLEGQTLAQVLASGNRLSTAECVLILTGIADGLAAIHRAHIVHRDLKPGNVFLVPDGAERRAVITDFGLARIFEAAPHDRPDSGTQTAMLVGTPEYMAPEQFQGKHCSEETDVYALGLIFYEMLCGHKPFPGQLLDTAIKRITGPVPRLRPMTPIPNSWQRCLDRCLAADPSKRYRDPREFVSELRNETRFQFSWKRPSRRTWIVGVASVSGVMACIFGISRSKDWSSHFVSQPLIMIAGTTSAGQDRDSLVAAAVVDEVLRKQLTQSRWLKVIGVEQVQAALRRKYSVVDSPKAPSALDGRTARDVALRLGGNVVLFSNLSRTGDEKLLRVRMEVLGQSTETAKSSIAKDFPYRNESDIPESIYEAARWLRHSIGEAEPDLERHSHAPEEMTTASWQALKEYTLGDQEWKAGKPGPAILHLKTALSIDEQFAMADTRLADILVANGQTDDALGHYAHAVKLLTARNLTDRESLRTQGLFYLDVGLNKEALDVFERYVLEYPEDPLPRFYRAACLGRLARPKEAEASLNKAINMAPENPVFRLGRAQHFLELGQIGAAEHDLRTAANDGSDGWFDQIAMAIAFAKSDMAGVKQRILQMRAGKRIEFTSKSYALECCFLAEQREWAGAEKILRKGIEFDEGKPVPIHALLTKKRMLAEMLFDLKRAGEGRCVCEEILASEPGVDVRFQVACLLAANGMTSQAEQVGCGLPFSDEGRGRNCVNGFWTRRLAGPAHCEGMTLPKWPIYEYWQLRLNLEIALSRGGAHNYSGMVAAVPEQIWLHYFPAYLLRLMRVDGHEKWQGMLKRFVSLGAGLWWLEPERNPPGLYRTLVESIK